MSDREEQIITNFQNYLAEITNQTVNYQKIATTHAARTPDFVLTPLNYVVEVKEILDHAEVKTSAAWGGTTKRLHASIDTNPKTQSLNGSYLVDTPYPFSLPNNPALVTRVVDGLLDAIINTRSRRFEKEIEGFTFKISKYSPEGHHISFSWSGNARSIDPPTTVHENIFSKVVHANEQLQYELPDAQIEKRVLLLVNDYVFARSGDVIRGLSYSFDNLITLNAIDEIWLQSYNHSTHQSEHKLIYTKAFIEGLQNNELDTSSIPIFEEWFYALNDLGDDYKDKLFSIFKHTFATEKPHDLIKDQFVRAEMVRLGEWLYEKNRANDVTWLIETFIDDKSPPSDPNTEENPDLNFDQQIRDGKKNFSITTVLGHLAWVVQKLTQKKEYIAQAFIYTKKLTAHPNLYVKLQSLIPLIEITRRRQWLQEIDDEQGTKYYDDLKKLDFDLLNDCSQFPAIADWLAHLFFYFRDLKTSEVLQVLNKVKSADEASALFVYFAIFRKNHYTASDGQKTIVYDPKPIEDLLKDVIRRASENENLVGSITWQLGKILREAPDDFDEVKPWVDFLLEQPFQKDVIDHLSMSLEMVYANHPDIALRWLKTIIDKSYVYVKSASVEDISRSFWVDMNHVEWIAEHEPDNLIKYIEKIYAIWRKGAYVGDPERILTSYRFVSSQPQKNQLKEKCKVIYAKMKNDHPPLKEFNWP